MRNVRRCLKEFDNKMKDKGFQVSVEGSGKVINCRENEALLIAMERQGYAKVPVGCRKGGCGVCKIKVIKGDFKTGKMSIRHVSEDEKKQNFSLACKTFPKTDLHFALIQNAGRVINTEALEFDHNC